LKVKPCPEVMQNRHKAKSAYAKKCLRFGHSVYAAWQEMSMMGYVHEKPEKSSDFSGFNLGI